LLAPGEECGKGRGWRGGRGESRGRERGDAQRRQRSKKSATGRSHPRCQEALEDMSLVGPDLLQILIPLIVRLSRFLLIRVEGEVEKIE
jgi:hypothetical protein